MLAPADILLFYCFCIIVCRYFMSGNALGCPRNKGASSPPYFWKIRLLELNIKQSISRGHLIYIPSSQGYGATVTKASIPDVDIVISYGPVKSHPSSHQLCPITRLKQAGYGKRTCSRLLGSPLISCPN